MDVRCPPVSSLPGLAILVKHSYQTLQILEAENAACKKLPRIHFTNFSIPQNEGEMSGEIGVVSHKRSTRNSGKSSNDGWQKIACTGGRLGV